VTAESTRTLADEIAKLWAGRDIDTLTSAAAKYLTTGSATRRRPTAWRLRHHGKGRNKEDDERRKGPVHRSIEPH